MRLINDIPLSKINLKSHLRSKHGSEFEALNKLIEDSKKNDGKKKTVVGHITGVSKSKYQKCCRT